MIRKALMAGAMTVAIMVTGAAGLPADAPPSDRLIFSDRDLGAAAKAGALEWRLVREGKPPEGQSGEGFVAMADGRLVLKPITDPADGRPMLEMREEGNANSRVVGRYPTTGMDPVLVYFLETATRNVSVLAQGNPDYIRNRFKDAMRKGGEIEPVTGPAGGQRVTLRPLAGDPNAAKMHGFDALTLTIELAPDPTQPIAALAATAPGYTLHLTRVAP